MSSSQPEHRSGEKVSDSKRIQKLLEDIKDSTRPDQRTQQGRHPMEMDESAKEMLMEYTIELASSIIESANAMAKHRGSQTIEPDDVNLIFAKKLGIELPGQSRIRTLHQHNLKSLYTPAVVPGASTTTASSKSNVTAAAASAAEAKKGSKRKLGN